MLELSRGPVTRVLVVVAGLVLAAVVVAIFGRHEHDALVAGTPPVEAVEVAPGTVAELHRPVDARDAPTVVLLHGCCGDPADLGAVARALAAHGVLVVNAGWTALADGGGWPRSYREATCAVAVARSTARQLGARADRVTVVGWSDGALLATVAGLGPPPPATGCPVTSGGRADAVVALDGFLGWSHPSGVLTEGDDGGASAWFGGEPQMVPSAWAGGNPATLAATGVRPRARHATLDLVGGLHGPLGASARRIVRALRRAGVSVEVHDTQAHDTRAHDIRGGWASVVTPRTRAGTTALTVVLDRASTP